MARRPAPQPSLQLDPGVGLRARPEESYLELALADGLDHSVETRRQSGDEIRQKLWIVDSYPHAAADPPASPR
jgi:hypothetical protein